jgi:homocysteine S-methyltransferase
MKALWALEATLHARIEADRLASRSAQERCFAAHGAHVELRDDIRRLRDDIVAASLVDEVQRQSRRSTAIHAEVAALRAVLEERAARARAEAEDAVSASVRREVESLRETCDALLTREELQYREAERCIAGESDVCPTVFAAQQRVAQLVRDVARLKSVGAALRKRQRRRSAVESEADAERSGACRQLHDLRGAISSERRALGIGTRGLARFLRDALVRSVVHSGWELRARVSFLCERQKADLGSKRDIVAHERRLAELRARRVVANGAGSASSRSRSRECSPDMSGAPPPDVHRGAARALWKHTRDASAGGAAAATPSRVIVNLRRLDRTIALCAARLARERAMRQARFGAEALSLSESSTTLRARLAANELLVLDGGFSTHCEALGADLSIGKLWSARLIDDDPDLICRVHRDFMDAGADIISTASYQASIRGLVRSGKSRAEARATLESSVALAVATRDAWWAKRSAVEGWRRRPLVGAALGSFGAYLGDGSEYTGSYDAADCTVDALRNFHREQAAVLLATAADVLMFETVPCAAEAAAIAALLREAPFAGVSATLSFCCADDVHLASGERLADAARAAGLASVAPLVAVGVNCTPPQFVASLLAELAPFAGGAAPLAYANSGETFVSTGAAGVGAAEVHGAAANEARVAGWHRGAECVGADPVSYAAMARCWLPRRGGAIVGGCCRTTPEHTRQLRRAVAAAHTQRAIIERV